MQSKRQKKLAYYVFLQKHDYQQKNENYICEITKFGGIFIVNSFKLITITHKTANINHIGKYIPSVNSNPEKLAATLHHIKKVLHIDTANKAELMKIKVTPVINYYAAA